MKVNNLFPFISVSKHSTEKLELARKYKHQVRELEESLAHEKHLQEIERERLEDEIIVIFLVSLVHNFYANVSEICELMTT